ncbi:glycerol uptake facilitator related permease (major Intrinsic protein family) [Paucilactobacillus oligofermentans DSM 15707 = LMG 22743]|uniref:Glycerol uptake facilitator related permease (Major Intrinsic protein family) n=1 Tax=Paucilactobacillus oligofermentans DSM 15707 = LMG 22743 TaxID=1423778 RepID=A0A0R1RLW6_9LACO|nr:MIP/aquaporin family protein [Paucilactobacillus oligofermentans]KRL57846.1 glycerol uptake facilitator related permease (major Intrinsic protein family) [Paucilactobacillus oligofermentans DSM 15707 = LMG 22743]CUS26686.1 Glycerol facilitator-aquaporin 1 [Paucilactobacillus oligofermentans DSM 15707 = LMG 22743]
MHYSLLIRVIAEFIGTTFLVVLGNGSVANVELKGTKGFHGGWILIGLGYGAGVLIPAMMFGSVSGNHINPALTLGLAINGMFPWNEVLPYISAQILGAIFGQLIVVWCYKPYYNKTTDHEAILGTFSTIDAAHSYRDGFINEFVGTFILVFGALAMTKNIAFEQNIALANFSIGFLVATLVISMGGATGPALNPVRDIGPRLVHALYPLKNKGDSHWDYSWVPVVAPILAGILATFVYKTIFI